MGLSGWRGSVIIIGIRVMAIAAKSTLPRSSSPPRLTQVACQCSMPGLPSGCDDRGPMHGLGTPDFVPLKQCNNSSSLHRSRVLMFSAEEMTCRPTSLPELVSKSSRSIWTLMGCCETEVGSSGDPFFLLGHLRPTWQGRQNLSDADGCKHGLCKAWACKIGRPSANDVGYMVCVGGGRTGGRKSLCARPPHFRSDQQLFRA
jgi:hypothetical protein